MEPEPEPEPKERTPGMLEMLLKFIARKFYCHRSTKEEVSTSSSSSASSEAEEPTTDDIYPAQTTTTSSRHSQPTIYNIEELNANPNMIMT